MKITRIRVPEFRALKNIDITFEPDFTPNIFPLASLNGGGKSTLLQLIFILLKSLDPDLDTKYINNLLKCFEFHKNNNTIAYFDIRDEFIEYSVEYQLHNQIYTKSEPGIDEESNPFGFNLQNSGTEEYDFSIFQYQLELQKEIDEQLQLQKAEEEKIRKTESRSTYIVRKTLQPIDFFSNDPVKKLRESRVTAFELENQLRSILFKEKELVVITYFNKELPNNIDSKILSVLTCKVSFKSQSSQDREIKVNEILNEMANKVFLAIPSTQPILFLDDYEKKMLFQDKFDEYQGFVQEAKKKLLGFSTYSFLPVNLIQSFFDKVFNLDIQKAIETKGEYGNQYKQLIEQINCVLENKIVNISPDRKTITFEMEDENGEFRKLYPEDLSHGELKRLSIYLWLKYYDIKDAVVLMDEIEIAFHPDWQYQIINDLQEWGASNQYILATHSYELCQALTPAHVKEISPSLLPSQENES